METVKTYYQLAKPGIIYGNLLSTVAGFLLAAKGSIDIFLFGATLLGTALVIASSCVINNYTDREVDRKMKRTKDRALALGIISIRNATVYAIILGVAGFGTLILFTNWLVVLCGAIGMIFYTIFYGFTKRKNPIGTVVGTIPGAMPIVAGYVAVSNQIDLGAILLFLIMVFWQIPHFYAIGIFRLKDYREAGLPILPVARGIRVTKVHMLVCMILYLVFVLALSFFHYTGMVYFIVMLALGLRWLMLGIQGFKSTDEAKWGRKVFGFSLICLLSFSVLLCLNVVLP